MSQMWDKEEISHKKWQLSDQWLLSFSFLDANWPEILQIHSFYFLWVFMHPGSSQNFYGFL